MKGDERMLVAGKESEEETVKVVKGDHEKRLEDGRERISEDGKGRMSENKKESISEDGVERRVEELKRELAKKDAVATYRCLQNDPIVLKDLCDIMEYDPSALKYQAQKVVMEFAKHQPLAVFAYHDQCKRLLHHENAFLRYGMVSIIAMLMQVGNQEMASSFRECYMENLMTQEIAAFGNTIKGMPALLQWFPEEEKKLLMCAQNINNHVFYHHGQISIPCQMAARRQILGFLKDWFRKSAYPKEWKDFINECAMCQENKVQKAAKQVMRMLNKKVVKE